MQLYTVLVLSLTLSAAYGLTGQTHVTPNTYFSAFLDSADHCAIKNVNNLITESCFVSTECKYGVPQRHVYGTAIPTGSSVLLLLVSSAINTVFL